MTLLERENAIRKITGRHVADVISDGSVIWESLSGDTRHETAYYGGIDSIGIVLRDVVPRLFKEKYELASVRRVWFDYQWPRKCVAFNYETEKAIVECDSIEQFPAACCDSLLKKEGLLT